MKSGTRLEKRCQSYGITVDQFIAMFYVQSFRCKICKRELQIEGTGKSAIDHCHTSNKVRGILCTDCNLLLGRLEDKGLDEFINYLSSPFNIGNVKPRKKYRKRLPGEMPRPSGRPLTGQAPMTAKERVAKHRAKKKAEREARR